MKLIALFQQLIATTTAYFIFHTNHMLRLLADLFASSTLDKLSISYSNWYNLNLISQVINYKSKDQKISINVDSIDGSDNLLIATLSYNGISLNDVELYLIQSLSAIVNVNINSLQISHISHHCAKVIFSMNTSY